MIDSENRPLVRNTHIVAYDKLGGECLEYRSWTNLPFPLVIKYGWYFKYIHALLQVKYPKGHIETFHKNVVAEGRSLERIKENRCKKDITTYKRMITKLSNQIENIENDLKKELFPNFQDAFYLRTKEKLKKYQLKLEAVI